VFPQLIVGFLVLALPNGAPVRCNMDMMGLRYSFRTNSCSDLLIVDLQSRNCDDELFSGSRFKLFSSARQVCVGKMNVDNKDLEFVMQREEWF
jgi:hypothetical protein